jgi:hypothetical protein
LEEGIVNKNARSEFRASVKKKMFFESFVARSRSVSQRRKTVPLFQSAAPNLDKIGKRRQQKMSSKF